MDKRLEEIEIQILAAAEVEQAEKEEKEKDNEKEKEKGGEDSLKHVREHPWNFLRQAVRPRILTKPAGWRFWSVRSLGLTYYQYEKIVTLLNYAEEEEKGKEREEDMDKSKVGRSDLEDSPTAKPKTKNEQER